MTQRPADDRRRSQASRPEGARRPARAGGPLRITPARATLAVALVGGLAFLAWSIIVRDALQIPLMASGFAIIALVFGAMALMAVASVVRAGRDGRDGRAVLLALVGGLLAIAAFMAFAGAVIMALIWGGTSAS
jgi:hypothetical protein